MTEDKQVVAFPWQFPESLDPKLTKVDIRDVDSIRTMVAAQPKGIHHLARHLVRNNVSTQVLDACIDGWPVAKRDRLRRELLNLTAVYGAFDSFVHLAKTGATVTASNLGSIAEGGDLRLLEFFEAQRIAVDFREIDNAVYSAMVNRRAPMLEVLLRKWKAHSFSSYVGYAASCARDDLVARFAFCAADAKQEVNWSNAASEATRGGSLSTLKLIKTLAGSSPIDFSLALNDGIRIRVTDNDDVCLDQLLAWGAGDDATLALAAEYGYLPAIDVAAKTASSKELSFALELAIRFDRGACATRLVERYGAVMPSVAVMSPKKSARKV